MKRIVIFFTILSMSLSGCGKTTETNVSENTSSETNSIHTVNFTDDLGRNISVNQPQRVAVLLGSYAQAWALAGGDFCAAADDVWEEYELELSEDVINLGNTKSLSLELLLSAQPDFVIASTKTNQHLQWQDTLEAAGIDIAYFDVSNFNDYLRMFKIFTDITGKTQLYQTYGLDVLEQIDTVVEKSKLRSNSPSVLVLRVSASSIRARGSQGNILGEILADLGCSNIADTDDSLLENLSIEHILQSDPDYIFIAQYGDDLEGIQTHVKQFVADNPAWAQLSAVKNDQVYYMEKALFSLKPNHRWGEAYEQLEEILENEP